MPAPQIISFSDLALVEKNPTIIYLLLSVDTGYKRNIADSNRRVLADILVWFHLFGEVQPCVSCCLF